MPPPLPIPRAVRDIRRKRINRAPSPALALTLPWVLVIFGSLLPTIPTIASTPLMPPLGYMLLVAQLQQRPGLFPAWAGFPLGLVDDLFSGQPFGSAALLWSLTVLLLEAQEYRFPWRNYLQDWAVGTALVAGYLLLAALLAGIGSHPVPLAIILPQIGIAVLAFPLAGRIAAVCDKLRLYPLRDIG